MPASIKSAYNSYINRLAINRIKADIEQLKERYKDKPAEIAKRTMALYKSNGIKFIDKNTLVNIASQGVIGLGMFQALKAMVFNSKFI